MLTPEEICIRRTARADVECEEQTDREVVRELVRIIDRLTQPETVLAEAERLFLAERMEAGAGSCRFLMECMRKQAEWAEAARKGGGQ